MRMKALRLVVGGNILLSAFAASVALPGAALAADPPASLAGETFQALERASGSIGTIEVTRGCTPTAGATFTLTYEAEGVASGPYPGTFTERGTVTGTMTQLSGTPGFALGFVTSWSAEFEIDSPLGDVSGTTTLLRPHNQSECVGPPLAHETQSANAQLTYEATIRPATGGRFTDAGEAIARVAELACSPGFATFCFESLDETFWTSTGVVQVLPQDTKDCKHGGHEDFGLATEKECKDAVKEQKAASR